MKVNVVSESGFTVRGHGVHTAFTETIEALRIYTDCEVVVNSREPADVVHIHTVGPYSTWKLLFAGGARVVSAHVTPDSFVGSLIGAKYWKGLAKVYLRWFYNRADSVLAVSSEVVDELKRMGVIKPIHLVPNTIATAPFEPTATSKADARRHLGWKAEAFVIVGSGQVQPRKRLDSFISVANQIPTAQFVWVGGMPFKALAAESKGMDKLMKHPPANVVFAGQVEREDISDYYRAADAFFLPSEQETFGIVVVEAAAAGLPIVLRDLSQYRITFMAGYAGFDSNKGFAGELQKLMSDATYYNKRRLAASKISTTYGAEAGARRLMEVYGDVVAHRASHHKA